MPVRKSIDDAASLVADHFVFADRVAAIVRSLYDGLDASRYDELSDNDLAVALTSDLRAASAICTSGLQPLNLAKPPNDDGASGQVMTTAEVARSEA